MTWLELYAAVFAAHATMFVVGLLHVELLKHLEMRRHYAHYEAQLGLKPSWFQSLKSRRAAIQASIQGRAGEMTEGPIQHEQKIDRERDVRLS